LPTTRFPQKKESTFFFKVFLFCQRHTAFTAIQTGDTGAFRLRKTGFD